MSVDPSVPRSIAVLGGSGFLGAHVVRRALEMGVERVASFARDPWRALPSDEPRLTFVALDASAFDDLEQALDEFAPQALVLCAAHSRMADCERDSAAAVDLNARLPARVAQWSERHRARLVHVSTDLVFGAEPPPTGGFRESDPPAPISVYGVTKAAGERAVLEYEPSALVVRLPLLFGDSFGRGLGASDSLLAALERGEAPLLFRDEKRTPLDVSDAASALVELTASSISGVLHVAGPRPIDRARLALAVLTARGESEAAARGRVRIGLRADAGLEATRPADTSLDATAARSLLRTRLRSIDEALAAR